MVFFLTSSFLLPIGCKNEALPPLCQCPSTGLSHFYLLIYNKESVARRVCQCPSTGLSHFYKRNSKQRSNRKRVSMPFYGLIPSLRVRSIPVLIGEKGCQCPSTDLSHFYLTHIWLVLWLIEGVNALLRAYPISTVHLTSCHTCGCVVSMPFYRLIPFYGTLWKPSIFKASQSIFCKQFTEYSDKSLF